MVARIVYANVAVVRLHDCKQSLRLMVGRLVSAKAIEVRILERLKSIEASNSIAFAFTGVLASLIFRVVRKIGYPFM